MRIHMHARIHNTHTSVTHVHMHNGTDTHLHKHGAHASTHSNHAFLFFSSDLLISLPCSNFSCISKGRWGNPEVLTGWSPSQDTKGPKTERWVPGGGALSFLKKYLLQGQVAASFPRSGHSTGTSLTAEVSLASSLQRARICPRNANQPTDGIKALRAHCSFSSHVYLRYVKPGRKLPHQEKCSYSAKARFQLWLLKTKILLSNWK